jgi:hypothetical protein
MKLSSRLQIAMDKRLCGQLVAELLAGAWRVSPPPLRLSAEEVTAILPFAIRSGVAGSAWARLRRSDLALLVDTEELQQMWRFQTLETAIQQHHLQQVIPLLREAGVEPVLVKGWAVARLYPEAGLRPYCDIDLCVLPEQYEMAQTIMRRPEAQGFNVDLHRGFGREYDRQTDMMFARTKLVKLGNVEVRILGDEDQLHFLCSHLLRHGATRPLWLCDIALTLEAQADNFDWDKCLAGAPRQKDWLRCALGLAHHLLGVDIDKTPLAKSAKELPGWVILTVLKAWGRLYESPRQLRAYLRHPVELIKELPYHWPNPIMATMTVNGRFNKFPRLPLQIGHLISRSAALLRQRP